MEKPYLSGLYYRSDLRVDLMPADILKGCYRKGMRKNYFEENPKSKQANQESKMKNLAKSSIIADFKISISMSFEL